jgi:hypothetical protein
MFEDAVADMYSDKFLLVLMEEQVMASNEPPSARNK